MRRELENARPGLRSRARRAIGWASVAALAASGVIPARAAQTHVSPVPSVPRDLDPAAANDVFSISAVTQLHRSLFRLDRGRPLPDAASDFTVSKDRKVFEVVLKKLAFAGGAPARCEDVRYSIERAISRKVPGFEKLQSIERIECEPGQPERARFKLKGPDPRLPLNLADFRFAILAEGKSPEIGLGAYRVQSRSADALRLSRVTESARDPGPSEVTELVYQKATQDEAIQGFNEGKFQDLFSFQLSPPEAERVRAQGWVHEVPSPRIYLLMVNSTRLGRREVRQSIEAALDRRRLVERCYPSNNVTDSVVPRGFLGYDEAVPRPSVKSAPLPKTLRICIADGVGSEACVKDELERALRGKVAKLEVRVEPTASCNDQWQANTVDGFFAYLEAESSLEFFKFFNPGSEFFLGDKKDTGIARQIDDWEKAPDDPSRYRQAIALSRHIRGLGTAVPFFSPRQYLALSKKYEDFEPSVQASSFIRFDQLRLRK